MPSAHTIYIKKSVLLALAIVAMLAMVAAMPHKASASGLSLSTATTSSSNASTTLAKVGDTVSYRIVLSGTPWETPKINIFSLGTTTMSGSGTTYTYSTTTSSAWTNGFVSFYVSYGGTVYTDATSTIASTSLTSANVRFDKTAPTISTITSSATAAGALKVGDTITFTLTPGATEYGATVAGSYNGHSLTWSTANSGVTFTATYTVTEGDADQSTALQITGVVITDAAGNASSAGAGSDIAKTIDANSPSAPTANPPASSFIGDVNITLTSSGSNSIRYSTDGTTPSCSTGGVYSDPVHVTGSLTLSAIGCDTAGNGSSVASFAYTRNKGGGGSSSGHHYTSVSTGATTPAAAPSTAPGSVGSFVRDLFVGASGDDVKALQVFLNTHGFMIAASGAGSKGMETMTFGALTKAALAKFQAAHGISAIGRMGPMTRAAIAAMQ